MNFQYNTRHSNSGKAEPKTDNNRGKIMVWAQICAFKFASLAATLIFAALFTADQTLAKATSEEIIFLHSDHGTYMGVHSNGSVYAGSTIDIWEKFTKSNYSDGRISLRSHHNTYLWVDQEGMVHGDATDLGDWGKFTQIPSTNGTYLFKSHHNTYLGVRASGLVYANNLQESGKVYDLYVELTHQCGWFGSDHFDG